MPVVETFFGYVETTKDSLLLLEACRQGVLPRVRRRLQDQERHLVKSGAVFCFDESESGIKRWTDGLVWSPSRILGNFLIYRELSDRRSTNEAEDDLQHVLENTTQQITSGLTLLSKRQRERSLVGSLRNSYQFKPNGLIKKSMSVLVNGVHQHLISYYNKNDVLTNKFQTPSMVSELATLNISAELLSDQHFRVPYFLEDGFNDKKGVGSINSSGADKPARQKKRSASYGQFSNKQSPRRHCRNCSTSSTISGGSIGNSSSISTPSLDVSLLSSSSSGSMQGPSQQLQTYTTAILAPTNAALMAMKQRHFSDTVVPSLQHHHPAPSSTPYTQYQPQAHNKDPLSLMPANGQNHQTVTPHNVDSLSSLVPMNSKYHSSAVYQGSRVQPTAKISELWALQQQLDTLPASSCGVGSDAHYQPWAPHTFSTSDQNPHQHLFSSSSFHAINHASLHASRTAEVVSNAFMLDTSMLLGSGWNDFELQM